MSWVDEHMTWITTAYKAKRPYFVLSSECMWRVNQSEIRCLGPNIALQVQSHQHETELDYVLICFLKTRIHQGSQPKVTLAVLVTKSHFLLTFYLADIAVT